MKTDGYGTGKTRNNCHPMKKYVLPLVVYLAALAAISAQEYRSIDGSGNNPFYPSWGAQNTTLTNYVPFDYADGFAEPNGANRPNPRRISNIVFNQDNLINDPQGLSDLLWNFGQFIDHEVTFVPDTNELLVILTQPTDPFFLGVPIFMNRSLFDPSTGTGPGNPRRVINIVTPFIDGSAVYGSDEEHAQWLRTFNGGKLKTSAGNLLPFNTITGEFGDPIDHSAPEMDNPTGIDSFIFVAGDARVNEQPNLIAFHTLFVREHNRMCDLLAGYHPDWNDEQLYQYARKMVGGLLQHIIFEEWLPAAGVELPPYSGYKPNVNPQISNIFSAAAFRLGHTLLNSTIRRLDNDGNVIPQGNLTLKDGFFHPWLIYGEGGIEPLFKGMGTQVQQELDAKIIGDVRNFLFGQPGSGGLDLASININRARERGLPDFNSIREALGLSAYGDFLTLTQNTPEALALNEAYNGNINHLDPWVGMLAEAPMPGALFGETIVEILKRQFQALRDGDRFFYANDPDLNEEKRNEIRNTRLVDIIRRNTGIDIMQDQVFEAMDHDDVPTCQAIVPEATIEGGLQTEDGQSIGNVKVELFNGYTMMPHYMTFNDGIFHFNDLPTCYDYSVIPYRNDDADAGVTTFDLIQIQRHILNIDPLDSPYKLIAADANHSGHISTADLIEIRRVILHASTSFPYNTSWRFVPSTYTFKNPDNPLMERIPESVMFDMLSQQSGTQFTGIKIGDVDNSVDLLISGQEVSARSERPVRYLTADDIRLSPDQIFEIPVYGDNFQDVFGYQFTLNFSPENLEFVEILGGPGIQLNEGNYNWMSDAHALTVSWNGDAISGSFKEEPLFYLVVKSHSEAFLSSLVSMNSRYTASEAYHQTSGIHNLGLKFNKNGAQISATNKYELYQNTPNPVVNETTISFWLPESAPGNLSITDASGKIVKVFDFEGSQGLNSIRLSENDLPSASGVYFYTLQTGFGHFTKRLVKRERF